jgi:hypothetical protein
MPLAPPVTTITSPFASKRARIVSASLFSASACL